MIIGKDIHQMLNELDMQRARELGEAPKNYTENRKYRRSRVVWEAQVKVYFNDITLKSEVREVHGVVRDISANGARLDLDQPIIEKVGLVLVIPKLGKFPCETMWCKGKQVGIQFKDSPDNVFQHLIKVLPNA
ncbi:PilZ domain-containing protein [Sneathiella limimaris]|uniref:PilZ domain-containing protein n=1 Tax=Sneathiella limimaris TaxID=1964213 RepID=UPI00146F808D|nr:PilZ domain-containing protein [Sneathiella limimaris]